MSKCPNGSFGAYLEGDWREDLRPPKGSKPPKTVSYRGELLNLGKPDSEAGECATLQLYVDAREQLKGDISRQARGYEDVAGVVLKAIGLSTNEPVVNPEFKELRDEIVDDLLMPIRDFKWIFGRARPSSCCGPELAPMFLRGHILYPGTPAYPSGHATVAWTFAYLFGAFVSAERKAALDAAAAQVALNREIAGVHYPTDTAAGRLLAGQVVKIMLSSHLAELKARRELIKRLV
jgi:PAP2 superfamily